MSKPLPEDVLEHLEKLGLHAEADGKVEWRDHASGHPKNWPVRRKILDTGVITVFVIISCVFRA